VLMFSVPAMAMEHQFGGFWRTRFYTNQNFDGNDIEPDTGDWTAVDTRTRLRYTAVFHENLRFVNRFEIDGSWGSSQNGDNWPGRLEAPGNEWTDIGADGANLEIKNSFADFRLGPIHATVGVQGTTLGRGFLFSDDFAGMIVGYEGAGITVPFIWMKVYEGGVSDNALDVDYYGISPEFNLSNVRINPYILYLYSDNAREFRNFDTNNDNVADVFTDELNIFYAGLDVDLNFDPVSVWFTGIYQGGDEEFVGGGDRDFEAWLGAVGLGFNFGMGDVHGQFFYATGDDGTDPNDLETFFVPTGDSYYWAEIMGFGMFDAATPTNTPSDDISNVMAANIGFSISPTDRLRIALDGWWAQLNEEILVGGELEDDLGVEVDLRITYQLIEGLNLDVVGAYLFAGDAIYNGNDDADPYEVGSQLSLSF